MDIQNKNIIEYVRSHDLEALKNLIKHEKEINLRFTDPQGRTLLHYCVATTSENGLPILQLLLENDADPQAVDETFTNALDIARDISNNAALALMNYHLSKKKDEFNSYL